MKRQTELIMVIIGLVVVKASIDAPSNITSA